MPCTFSPLSPAELSARWGGDINLSAPFPFVTPGWLNVWWRNFGADDELLLLLAEKDGQAVGLAPLRLAGGTVRFIGSADVCDYLDFVVREGGEDDFFAALLDNLAAAGVKQLELEALRPDSVTLKHLLPLARQRGLPLELTDTDVTLEMDLPADWETYLQSLSSHQRHEIKRKGRRLTEAVDVTFDIKEPDDVPAELAALLRLLRISRKDKAEFMTLEMEVFFRELAAAMADGGWLRFGHLRLNGDIVAAVMCFDYNNTRYLYNSGYEPEHSGLSVGLLSKVYSIQDAVERRMRVYDYLKGAEIYKYHLGGQEKPISNLRIELNGG
ncbi:MAG: GNAT family N-acetyltransferase [Dehalogenimonas sp.]|uniref:GNAT family N-acetyltransferase n=1 Tax=Candidatus Dehalogenimonas loeffleri TaxID=3127115 RepID=A0ABZ2J1V8_9CHLR|nr:GNAT family N-acetyltransferase [Dehalogenimonas sp.]